MSADTIVCPEGVRSIDDIEDSGPVVQLAGEIDLDLLMLELAGMGAIDAFDGQTWEDFHDEPTRIWSAPYHAVEPRVGWFRRLPANRGNCRCGNGHRWDLVEASTDEKPEGAKARGAFLAVWFA